MTIVPFGEYRPDVSDLGTEHTKTLLNVLPRADGYGPFADFVILSQALPAACRGYFFARNTDASVTIFAATATKLYKLSNTDFSWTDVSKAAGTYSSVPSLDQWQFVQFGSVVIAVQASTVPQAFTLGSSSEFADLGGAPPQAAYVAVVGRFVVLSGLLSNPYRVQWSGLNAITTWTSGTNSSDYQDLPDGGIARGVAGGETGIICQDQCLRRMNFVPGSAYVFSIERITKDKGIFAPLSLTTADQRLFFILNDGFYMLEPGGYPVQIGREKVDGTFFADVDSAALQLCIGASDPKTSRVYFAYKSLAGQSGKFDKLLVYDYVLQRFAPVAMAGEHLATLARPGLTLENLDSISGSIDALTFSLDDISTAALAQLSAFDANHKLGFFSGSALEATLESAEFGDARQRARVKGIVPITDAATVYCAIQARDTQQASPTLTAETLVNAQGVCTQNKSTRFGRARVRVPAGTAWTYMRGVDPDFRPEGQR